MKLHSREDFSKLNEATKYSDDELEKLDAEIRTYEITLENYLKKEFPSAEEDDIFKFIDDMSSAYTYDRRYDDLKKLISNLELMKSRFSSYSGINESKFDKLFGVKPIYLIIYDSTYDDPTPEFQKLEFFNDNNGFDEEEHKLVSELKIGDSLRLDSGHLNVIAYSLDDYENNAEEIIKANEEKCYLIDLKDKKIIKSGTKKELLTFDKFDENYDNKPRYISVYANELSKGNRYIKPNEYKIPVNESKFDKLFGADKLSHRIREFIDKYAAISPNWKPEENIENGDDEDEGKYTGPDVYALLNVANQLDQNIKLTRCCSYWSSGCFKPYASFDGQNEHAKIMTEINDIINGQ